MRILIQNIHIFSTDGEESVLNFSESLTFVYGNVGAGKSTMLNLIMYGLGGSNLLKNSALPVKEVCFSTGFSSESSFCSAFKRIEGVSPTQYRAGG